MFRKNKPLIIIGLGHIGLPLFFHYFNLGYDVYGVDRAGQKIRKLHNKEVYITEPGCIVSSDMVLRFSTDLPDIDDVNVLVAININENNGQYDISVLLTLIAEIDSFFTNCCITIRSTISLESIRELVDGLSLAPNTSLLFCPEFLREGLALRDLGQNNEYFSLVIDGGSHSQLIEVESFYDPGILTFLKLANNAWRATKVSFANMMMMMLDKDGLDQEQFYELFTADKLNVNKSYLRPGAPFGGYCLPKETKILSGFEALIGSSLLTQVLEVNSNVAIFWLNKILKLKPKTVYFETFSFKSNVDDNRSSPLLALSKKLNELDIQTYLYEAEIDIDKESVFVSCTGHSPLCFKGDKIVLIRGL
ncbi:hypothetical protein N8837_01095 [Pseudomonadales bacterium]|nr:hypothetical protein [Pseudomonadales bacterium]